MSEPVDYLELSKELIRQINLLSRVMVSDNPHIPRVGEWNLVAGVNGTFRVERAGFRVSWSKFKRPKNLLNDLFILKDGILFGAEAGAKILSGWADHHWKEGEG